MDYSASRTAKLTANRRWRLRTGTLNERGRGLPCRAVSLLFLTNRERLTSGSSWRLSGVGSRETRETTKMNAPPPGRFRAGLRAFAETVGSWSELGLRRVPSEGRRKPIRARDCAPMSACWAFPAHGRAGTLSLESCAAVQWVKSRLRSAPHPATLGPRRRVACGSEHHRAPMLRTARTCSRPNKDSWPDVLNRLALKLCVAVPITPLAVPKPGRLPPSQREAPKTQTSLGGFSRSVRRLKAK